MEHHHVDTTIQIKTTISKVPIIHTCAIGHCVRPCPGIIPNPMFIGVDGCGGGIIGPGMVMFP